MDRGETLLRGLQDKLKAWADYIQRCTHATVSFVPMAHGEFEVVVNWPAQGGPAGEYKKAFTRSFVFGGTFQLSPNAWTIERKACDHARDIVRDVLNKRMP